MSYVSIEVPLPALEPNHLSSPYVPSNIPGWLIFSSRGYFSKPRAWWLIHRRYAVVMNQVFTEHTTYQSDLHSMFQTEDLPTNCVTQCMGFYLKPGSSVSSNNGPFLFSQQYLPESKEVEKWKNSEELRSNLPNQTLLTWNDFYKGGKKESGKTQMWTGYPKFQTRSF